MVLTWFSMCFSYFIRTMCLSISGRTAVESYEATIDKKTNELADSVNEGGDHGIELTINNDKVVEDQRDTRV